MLFKFWNVLKRLVGCSIELFDAEKIDQIRHDARETSKNENVV